MLKTALIAITAMLASPAMAQVYKCTDPATGEKVYSQTQCSMSAEKIDVGTRPRRIERAMPESYRPATQAEIDSCIGALKRQYSYKDPESLRVEDEPVIGIYSTGLEEAMLMVNAKNSWGAYAGADLVRCPQTDGKAVFAIKND